MNKEKERIQLLKTAKKWIDWLIWCMENGEDLECREFFYAKIAKDRLIDFITSMKKSDTIKKTIRGEI